MYSLVVSNSDKYFLLFTIDSVKPGKINLYNFIQDNVIILWRRNEEVAPSVNIFQEDEESGREVWTVYKVLRFKLFYLLFFLL